MLVPVFLASVVGNGLLGNIVDIDVVVVVAVVVVTIDIVVILVVVTVFFNSESWVRYIVNVSKKRTLKNELDCKTIYFTQMNTFLPGHGHLKVHPRTQLAQPQFIPPHL